MKKVIILTCIGGHTTISDALKTYLVPSYNVAIKNIFIDILRPIDFVYFFTFGRYNTEDLYSFVLKKQWHSLMNFMLLSIGYPFFELRKKRIHALMLEHIKLEQPDLIISVIPFFNAHAKKIAQTLDIPFILMPTDVDITTFVCNLDRTVYNKFHIALPFAAMAAHKKFKQLCIPEDNTHITGVALKPAFFANHNPEEIKKQFLIPENKPVILLIMGSQGSASLYDFAKELSYIHSTPFHLIMVLGKNESQKQLLDRLKFPKEVTITIFGFTQRIPELMAISDILITKSGGISICEALYMNLPMLLDATSNVLVWERMNQEFVAKNKFGEIVGNLNKLSCLVSRLLHNKKALKNYKDNLNQFPKKNGGLEIKLIVDQYI